MNAFDQSLFLLLNAGPDTPAWALQAGVLIARRLILLLPVLFLSLWFIGGHRERRCLIQAVMATALALGINHLIGLAMPVPRPFVIELGYQWLAHAPTPSFPSNHLAVLLSCGLVLWRGAWPRAGLAVLLCAVVVAWARIFVGVHFPMDMLGALGTAGISAWLVAWLMTRLWPHTGRVSR